VTPKDCASDSGDVRALHSLLPSPKLHHVEEATGGGFDLGVAPLHGEGEVGLPFFTAMVGVSVTVAACRGDQPN